MTHRHGTLPVADENCIADGGAGCAAEQVSNYHLPRCSSVAPWHRLHPLHAVLQLKGATCGIKGQHQDLGNHRGRTLNTITVKGKFIRRSEVAVQIPEHIYADRNYLRIFLSKKALHCGV